MYSVKQLIYSIIDDYYALEDEKVLYKYKLSEMEEDCELDWEEDYEDAEF